jgi:hypothetical protein
VLEVVAEKHLYRLTIHGRDFIVSEESIPSSHTESLFVDSVGVEDQCVDRVQRLIFLAFHADVVAEVVTAADAVVV